MPEWPRLSGAEVVKILEAMGFRAVRQRGSHVVLRKGSAGCVVPLHREVKVGTLAGLTRQAGVDPADFIAAARTR
jgi:predicted RNA binding protein YcfA (HicA-like mRNA interferase family)